MVEVDAFVIFGFSNTSRCKSSGQHIFLMYCKASMLGKQWSGIHMVKYSELRLEQNVVFIFICF